MVNIAEMIDGEVEWNMVLNVAGPDPRNYHSVLQASFCPRELLCMTY